MKNWYKIAAYLFFAMCLILSISYADTIQPPLPFMGDEQKPAQPAQTVQKDDKRTLTVMTSDNKSVSIEKKDFLTNLFTPVGDFFYGIIKTSSDIVGKGCDFCLNSFDGVAKTVLSPFGFKPEPEEKRAYSQDESQDKSK